MIRLPDVDDSVENVSINQSIVFISKQNVNKVNKSNIVDYYHALVKQIFQPFIKDNFNNVHYISQCHRLTGKRWKQK